MNTTCTWCGTDIYVDEYDADEDLALCSGLGHPEPRMFQPAAERAARRALEESLVAVRGGIAADLGLYEDLPELLNEGEWAETAVVEFRYMIAQPDNYRWMLNRWGHVAQGPRKYSVTSFIGSTLGQLSFDTNVTYKSGPATGFFSYNSQVGYWTREPVPDVTTDISWERCATEAGIPPHTWPLP